MIQSNELRIGNLVLINGLRTEVSLLVLKHLIQNNIQFTVEGIPLTEEILLKCGFEKVPHFTIGNSMFLNLGRSRRISINSVGTPNETVFILDIDDDDNPTKVNDLVCIHNFDYDGKLYLHNLQNIVAVFGQELNTSGL